MKIIKRAIKLSYDRFHPNPRKHADYASKPFNTYGLDFDVDMELKMKDKAIATYLEGVLV